VKLLPWVLASLACSCAAPAPREAEGPAQAPVPPEVRWGEVEILQRHPALGEIPVAHGSTLYTGDEWAIRVRLHRTAFARLSRLDPRGKAAFDTDLGRVTEGSGMIRVPTGAGDYLRLESAPGTEYVVLMLSDAPLEPSAIEALRSSVLGAEPAPGAPRTKRRVRKPPPKAPPEAEPAEEEYRVLRPDERTGAGRGPYLEVAGGRRAASWIRFEHRATESQP